MNAASAKHVGAQLLGEIEEGSLEELLDSFRVNLTGGSNSIRPCIPIPALANIATRYHKATQSTPPPVLSVSGRYLQLLYHLISTLIAEPYNYTVVVVDADSRFDVTRLVNSRFPGSTVSSYPAQLSAIRHVYVYRPARGQDQVRAAVAAAGEWMLYGAHGSRAREWWGTVVIGGSGTGGGPSVKGDINAGWKGWVKVEREEIEGFPADFSVEEALRDREKRQKVVDDAGWVASSRVGSYLWRDN
ncbi:hypothetical protein Daesc_008000 [Daldinia eschscholtzii]|uniref:Uncharacterized protein n=1 Tax=Daldinia eschscholtzii TaxID=292717 RepID=A0AAX6MFS8_9PEZI